ncbi:MAG: hypothetical protein JW834_04605 [Candidatus Diapherotrites archaeon]|nr:hypothetical protein [Candidatus Diapherotrites archaeon]
MYLVDTCVLLHGFEERHGGCAAVLASLLSPEHKLGLTDFTLDELELKGSHKFRRTLEEAVDAGNVPLVRTGVRPGEWGKEKAYEDLVDEELRKLVADPSDGVLVAACERFGCDGVVSCDRHHIYTGRLWSYLESKGIHVLKPHEYVQRYGGK